MCLHTLYSRIQSILCDLNAQCSFGALLIAPQRGVLNEYAACKPSTIDCLLGALQCSFPFIALYLPNHYCITASPIPTKSPTSATTSFLHTMCLLPASLSRRSVCEVTRNWEASAPGLLQSRVSSCQCNPNPITQVILTQSLHPPSINQKNPC